MAIKKGAIYNLDRLHVAGIVKRGKILACATNALGTRTRGAGYSMHTIHAERNAVKALGDLRLLRGADLIVLRLPGPGMEAVAAGVRDGICGGRHADIAAASTVPTFLYSRPCPECTLFLAKCQRLYGLRNVYYTTDMTAPHLADVAASAARKRADAVAAVTSAIVASKLSPAAAAAAAASAAVAAKAAPVAGRSAGGSAPIAGAAAATRPPPIAVASPLAAGPGSAAAPPSPAISSGASVASTLSLSTAASAVSVTTAAAATPADDAISLGAGSGACSVAGDGSSSRNTGSGSAAVSECGCSAFDEAATTASCGSLRLLRGGDGSDEAEREALVWASPMTAADLDLLEARPTASGIAAIMGTGAGGGAGGGCGGRAGAATAAGMGARLVVPAPSMDRTALPAAAFVDRVLVSNGLGHGRVLASLQAADGDVGAAAAGTLKAAVHEARSALSADMVKSLLRGRKRVVAAAIAELPSATQRKRMTAAAAALEAARITELRRRHGEVKGR